MTRAFTGTPKFTGLNLKYAHVISFYGSVMVHTIDPLAKETTTIAMTPAQARALAQGIIEAADNAAADRAEAHQ